MSLMQSQPVTMALLSAAARFLAQHRSAFIDKPKDDAKPKPKPRMIDCQCGACVEARNAIAAATGRNPADVLTVIDIDGSLAAERPQILQTAEAFVVCGLAVVDAEPTRSTDAAKAIAERIARDPAGYISACIDLSVPGIHDLRPHIQDA